MRNSVNDCTIHRGQYGGLPGRDCTTITFLEETRLDYSRLTCYSYCNFDNNATSCYDQILCAIVSLCVQKYGIHKDVVFCSCQNTRRSRVQVKDIYKNLRNIIQTLSQISDSRNRPGLYEFTNYMVFYFQRVIPMS